jgi:hypothetical protein
MSVALDFGVTQVVDGNRGVPAIIREALFTGGEPDLTLPHRHPRSRPAPGLHGGPGTGLPDARQRYIVNKTITVNYFQSGDTPGRSLYDFTALSRDRFSA